MRRIFFITVLVLGMAAYGFAQTGGGMTGEQKQEGKMEQKGEMTGHAETMSHEDMIANMTEIMNQMWGMMGEMSEMIKDMPKDRMHKMSSIIKDMCSEMNRLSGLMDSGKATEKDMDAMQERMNEMQERMSDMMK
ncbi:MAG: hypothetical protein HZA16_13790 [Nitrospirae bacterium]|nr:hypothetical protein [Nitrospirota bacterium]